MNTDNKNMIITEGSAVDAVWAILETINDPEIPVLTITDLGIVRNVSINNHSNSSDPIITITITPTYSGCPAMDLISVQIKMAMIAAGFHQTKIEQALSPAWTTDWITEKGKQQLKAYGIAPPVGI
jgi:ring-1,2-phenylacetyl-CoA epoxidase subunit PaaD